MRRATGARTERSPAARRACLVWLTAVVALASAAPARACPGCAEGRAARGEVLADDCGFHLGVALLPFLVIGAICLRVEAIGRPPRPRAAKR